MLRRRTLLAAAGGLATLPAWSQSAPGFPSRAVRIVPFGTAGGPIDTLARIYGDRLSARWGQPVIVDAKPGASGIIATQAVAAAAPDGHTVLLTLPLTHVNNHILHPKLPYDPVADFEPLSMLGIGGPMIVALATAPYGNVRELVEFTRKKGRMTYGTWGNGSSAHLFNELLKRQTGADFVHVGYKSESQAHLDLFGGAIDYAWANPATAATHVKAGKMKVLGIAASVRGSAMPEVPTFKEQGFQGFDIDSWLAMYAPAKTPAPVVAAWVAALQDITKVPEVQEKLRLFSFEPLANNPAEFMARYRSTYPRVAQLIKDANLPPMQ